MYCCSANYYIINVVSYFGNCEVKCCHLLIIPMASSLLCNAILCDTVELWHVGLPRVCLWDEYKIFYTFKKACPYPQYANACTQATRSYWLQILCQVNSRNFQLVSDILNLRLYVLCVKWYVSGNSGTHMITAITQFWLPGLLKRSISFIWLGLLTFPCIE